MHPTLTDLALTTSRSTTKHPRIFVQVTGSAFDQLQPRLYKADDYVDTATVVAMLQAGSATPLGANGKPRGFSMQEFAALHAACVTQQRRTTRAGYRAQLVVMRQAITIALATLVLGVPQVFAAKVAKAAAQLPPNLQGLDLHISCTYA